MTSSLTQAFARAMAALVRDYDTAEVLAQLLDDAQTELGAAAVGLLVRTESGDLEVLTATSHRATYLELYQAQQEAGPCVDSIDNLEQIHVIGAAAITKRWPTVGRKIVDAGYVEVHAFPLSCRSAPLGP